MADAALAHETFSETGGEGHSAAAGVRFIFAPLKKTVNAHVPESQARSRMRTSKRPWHDMDTRLQKRYILT